MWLEQPATQVRIGLGVAQACASLLCAAAGQTESLQVYQTLSQPG
jgi:hypothetical protein